MSGQSRKFRSGKVESLALRTTSQSKTCHSLIPDRVFSHRGRVPSGPRRGCAPKGSLDGWPRCKTMFIEGMAEKNNKIITSVTILKAELSTLPRQITLRRFACDSDTDRKSTRLNSSHL